MYSSEDRLRAIKLYLELGRRMSATLRQLGYSNNNSRPGAQLWASPGIHHAALSQQNGVVEAPAAAFALVA